MKTCKWKQDYTYDYWWFAGCGKPDTDYIVDEKHPLPKYCPHCGGRVKIIDNNYAGSFNQILAAFLKAVHLHAEPRAVSEAFAE